MYKFNFPGDMMERGSSAVRNESEDVDDDDTTDEVFDEQ